MTGVFDSFFKKSKAQIIRDNAAQGKVGERNIKNKYEWSGYRVERTGKGHDYKVTKKNMFTGKKETKYIEVKTGKGKLSPLQKKKKRSFGKKYVVERTQPNPFFSVPSASFLNSAQTIKKNTTKHKSKSISSIFGNNSGFFGSLSTGKKTRKKTRHKSKSTSVFGGSSGFFGSLSTGKKTRKKTRHKSKSTSVFGSSSTGKKTRKTSKNNSFGW